MELTEQILNCKWPKDLPTSEQIETLPRGTRLKVVFGWLLQSRKERIGEKWKKEHPGFQIGVHTQKQEINVLKLITDEEIESHANFFENCAKDYRSLATRLINEFALEYGVTIDSDYPMNTLNPSGKSGYEQIGELGQWRYFFHGIHCGFQNKTTGQQIEVPLTYGLEFGELDPYFYSIFIRSTSKYHPLPVKIYSDYEDGKRILNKMLAMDKFEYVNSNWPDRKGIVVKDRNKVDVKVLESR